MRKISGIYKIINTVTGDFYIGSSKDVKHRWATHKIPSTWKRFPNKQLYKDMKKYSIGKFEFQILAEAEPGQLKEIEQQFIEKLQPTYNNYNAKGWDIERHKKMDKECHKKHDNQLCLFNGETLTLGALSKRFKRKGIPHSTLEAKKYLFN